MCFFFQLESSCEDLVEVTSPRRKLSETTSQSTAQDNREEVENLREQLQRWETEGHVLEENLQQSGMQIQQQVCISPG